MSGSTEAKGSGVPKNMVGSEELISRHGQQQPNLPIETDIPPAWSEHATLVASPPARLVTENVPLPDPDYQDWGFQEAIPEPSFAEQANAMINASLKRTPEGSSVVDTDSVLESGRLYHGYKDGKYFLPNDAVSSPDPGLGALPT